MLNSNSKRRISHDPITRKNARRFATARVIEYTQGLYIRAVRQLSEHYRKPPDQITEEELRQYFLYLMKVKQISPSTLRVALCGIEFFYERTLRREMADLELMRSPLLKELPVVLTIEEVHQRSGLCSHQGVRVCLSTIYACGLRIQEGDSSAGQDIDAQRGVFHICNGKGGKDRYVPLPEQILKMLRQVLDDASTSASGSFLSPGWQAIDRSGNQTHDSASRSTSFPGALTRERRSRKPRRSIAYAIPMRRICSKRASICE